MKSRRILLFALFTCVFALYGCVSSVSDVASERNLTMNIKENTFVGNVLDSNSLMPMAKNQVQKNDLIQIMNGTYDHMPRVRTLEGKLKATSTLQQVANDYTKQVKEKQKKLKEEKEKAEALRKEKEEAKKKQEAEERLPAFEGKITTYGVDCYGCSFTNGRGGTATGVALDINAGVQQSDGSFQPGIKYGNYYIVAADPSIPMYSILKISNHGLSGSGISPDEPFYAIVLDRGGAIYGGHLDLYIGSENSGAVVQAGPASPTIQVVSYGG